jgi:hypothetical protein
MLITHFPSFPFLLPMLFHVFLSNSQQYDNVTLLSPCHIVTWCPCSSFTCTWSAHANDLIMPSGISLQHQPSCPRRVSAIGLFCWCTGPVLLLPIALSSLLSWRMSSPPQRLLWRLRPGTGTCTNAGIPTCSPCRLLLAGEMQALLRMASIVSMPPKHFSGTTTRRTSR